MNVLATAVKPRSRSVLSVRTWRTIVALLVGAVLWELLGRYVITNGLFFAPLSAATPSTATEPGKYPAETFLIGLPAPNAVYWDIFIAKEKGFFKDEGLDAEYVLTNSSSASIQQLAAKAVNLGASTPDVLISAASKGSTNMKILFTTMNRLPWSLIVKGDYDLRVVGATPAKYAALQNDSIVAAVLYQPTDFTATTQGFKRLAFFTELDKQFPFPVYSVDVTWAGKSERGVRVARALVKSHQWLYDPKNKAEALQVLQKSANVAPDVGESTYKLFFEELKAYSREGEVDLPGLATAIEIMGEDGDLAKPLPAPEKFVETEMLKKAQAKQ